MDNCRVEVEYSSGTIVSIDTLAIEDAFDVTTIQQAALDYRSTTNQWNMWSLCSAAGWRTLSSTLPRETMACKTERRHR